MKISNHTNYNTHTKILPKHHTITRQTRRKFSLAYLKANKLNVITVNEENNDMMMICKPLL